MIPGSKHADLRMEVISAWSDQVICGLGIEAIRGLHGLGAARMRSRLLATAAAPSLSPRDMNPGETSQPHLVPRCHSALGRCPPASRSLSPASSAPVCRAQTPESPMQQARRAGCVALFVTKRLRNQNHYCHKTSPTLHHLVNGDFPLYTWQVSFACAVLQAMGNCMMTQQ